MSSVDVASMPWAFTQNQPLGTADVITEANRRGLQLDLSTLREFYRHGLLAPFVYVNSRRVGPIPAPVSDEPRRGGTLLRELRYARDRGRLSDLATEPFRPRLRFDQPDNRDSRPWWNGLIYSQYQLLLVPELRCLLAGAKQRWRDHQVIVRLPKFDRVLLDRVAKVNRAATALTALEARYLPTLDPERLHLVNTDEDEWGRYRDGFDPVAVSGQLGYPASQARKDAEWLLTRAYRLDPVGDSWSRLIRRAPSKAWKQLKDAALIALDYRIAAEILLLFYEDLVARSEVELLPDTPRMGQLRGRLSERAQTLDEDLMNLGISPHPRVVLVLEGETEYGHVPRVWKELDYPDAPELMRLLLLGGADNDPVRIAVLAATPLVGRKAPTQQPEWLLIKPPTRLFIAVDPEGKYFAPNKIDRTRANIFKEIRAALKAQGVDKPSPAELAELIEIRTWSASCYEFAHFDDEELADGIMTVHSDINGWSRDELIAALAHWRDKQKDIKRVWESGGWDAQRGTTTGKWQYEVSKTKLAVALWPTLKAKIDRCRTDENAPVPEIVKVVIDAYHLAQRWRYPSFSLNEELGG